jgi:hypothetical protein
MEQSLLMSQHLQAPESAASDVKPLEREMWQLERECRLLSSPSRNISRSSSPVRPATSDIQTELLTHKEQLADLKRQIQHITRSPQSPPSYGHSRQSTAEHHHHYYYYQTPEFSRELSINPPAKFQGTPIHSKFFRDLPTPPPTASSMSTISGRHERFNSSPSVWPQLGSETDYEESSPVLHRTFSHESIRTTNSNPNVSNAIITPTLKRSSSLESIFDPNSTPQFNRQTSPRRSPRSSPLSTSTTSSPTYLSASAYLRQNNTSSLLLLSSARGKQSRGLSSRKSFWNLWDKPARPGMGRRTSSLKKANYPPDLGGRVVVCTEVDVGMLQDALEG